MLVLFSDIHLTDGTSGETINQEAFDLFADQVAELARKRRADEVRLVLLGDGLDLLRSSLWNRAADGVRPWSPPSARQQAIVAEITAAILRANRQAFDHLCDIPRRVSSRCRLSRSDVSLDYVVGNHDWLINRYASTRRLVAGRLDLHSRYVRHGFPEVFHSPRGQYDLLARHGDIFDGLNRDRAAGLDASSVGDAIVVELLNRFPIEMARELADHPSADRIVRHLKEIDNVRPYSQAAAWIGGVMRDLGRTDRRFRLAARAAMARCAEHFLRDPALRQLADHLSWPRRQYLRFLVRRLWRNDMKVVDAWTQRGQRLWAMWQLARNRTASENAGYAECAAAERTPDGRRPRLVVYGHTHEVASAPIGSFDHADADERFYLNTGTWRTVWEKSLASGDNSRFSAWKVMSYVVVYNPREGYGRHEFELWHGSLRDRTGLVQASRAVPSRSSVPAENLFDEPEPVASAR
ncbi:MAG: hypothetical protein JXL80_17835 [Planctomycetes bacterium]|nr:hypothetical protein [Planctomycetota bacterium]